MFKGTGSAALCWLHPTSAAQMVGDDPQGTSPEFMCLQCGSGQVGQQCRRTPALEGGVSGNRRSRDRVLGNTEVGAGGGGGGGRVVRVPGSLAWKLGPLDYYCYLSIKGKRQSLEG